jgi:two-component system sensor histidine kinase MprB
VVGPDELAISKLQTGRSARTGRSSDGTAYRIVAVPMTELGNYALGVGRPLQPTNDILSSLWLVLIIFGAAGVVLAAIVGAAVARSSLAPVRSLALAVEHVSVTEELKPIEIQAAGDIALLAEAFNRMLQSRLVAERQQRLIADAPRLRTPLTSLPDQHRAAGLRRQHGHAVKRTVAILSDVTAQLAEFSSLVDDLVQPLDDQVFRRRGRSTSGTW